MTKEEIRNELLALADPKYAAFSRKLIPSKYEILGVRAPLIDTLAKKIVKNDAEGYLNNHYETYFEEMAIQASVISGLKGDFNKIAEYAETFIPKIDNWATCDSFCTRLKNMAKYKEETWNFINPYLKSGEEFRIRFALIMALAHFIDIEHVDRILSLANAVDHDGYYVKMGNAWLISVCFVKFPEKTMKYLENNSLDDFTYNKALQKITESYRVAADTKTVIRSMKRKTEKLTK